MKKTFTVKEAAEELGVSPSRVRQLVLDGSLPAGKFGPVLAISADAIEAAKKRKTSPGPVPKHTSTTKRSTGQKSASYGPSGSKKRR
jgi:excisionase family DNA binding protein